MYAVIAFCVRRSKGATVLYMPLENGMQYFLRCMEVTHLVKTPPTKCLTNKTLVYNHNNFHAPPNSVFRHIRIW